MARPASFVPKASIPFPVGTRIAGKVISKISARLYKIELSGKFYTAELAAKDRPPFSPGERVYVRITSKSATKAFLEIVDSGFPHIDSPSPADIDRLAKSAGWPVDDAARLLVAALVARRLPLQSELANRVYRELKAMTNPNLADADRLLRDFQRREESHHDKEK